jgi:aminoglycoside phosphotransferase (APT) family kinase protein
MPVPAQRDREEAREALTRWIEARQPGSEDVWVSEVGGPTYSGYSHETLLFDARWKDVEGRRIENRFVARVKPSRHTVFPDDAFAAEHRVMSALGSTDVPLPKVFGLEKDTTFLGSPFFVMERVDGDVPMDNPPYTTQGWLLDAIPENQARVWWSGLEAMAAVNRIDIGKFDLGFLRASRTGEPGPASELAYWREYQSWVGANGVDTLERAFGRLDRELLDGSDGEPGLCWGDSRIGNQMFDDFTCVAVLDWEMATIAEPEMDLAWFLYFDRVFSEGLNAPRPPGFPTHAASVERWEALTGRTVRRLQPYMIFAGVKFSLVLMRLGVLLVEFEVLPPDTEFGIKSFAMEFLARQLDEPPMSRSKGGKP